MVEGVTGGNGAYDFSVDVDDEPVASIPDIALRGDPSAERTEFAIADDGSRADVMAALADTNDSGSVVPRSPSAARRLLRAISG